MKVSFSDRTGLLGDEVREDIRNRTHFALSRFSPHIEQVTVQITDVVRNTASSETRCLPRLAAALEKIRPSTELHVDFEHLTYIDHACLDLLINWEKQHEATGGKLVIDWDTLHARFHGETGKGGQMPEQKEVA